MTARIPAGQANSLRRAAKAAAAPCPAVGEDPGDALRRQRARVALWLASTDRTTSHRRSARRAQTHVVRARTPRAIGRGRGPEPAPDPAYDRGWLAIEPLDANDVPGRRLEVSAGERGGRGRRARPDCFQAPEVRRVPFQRHVRDLVPPVGKQWASPGRNTNWVSRMPDPTASRSAPLFRVNTSCQVPAVRRKTTQPAVLPQLGIASDAAIAWLPGPANAPQSTWATGLDTSGSPVEPRRSRSTTRRASAGEQGPEADVTGAEAGGGRGTFSRLRTAVSHVVEGDVSRGDRDARGLCAGCAQVQQIPVPEAVLDRAVRAGGVAEHVDRHAGAVDVDRRHGHRLPGISAEVRVRLRERNDGPSRAAAPGVESVDRRVAVSTLLEVDVREPEAEGCGGAVDRVVGARSGVLPGIGAPGGESGRPEGERAERGAGEDPTASAHATGQRRNTPQDGSLHRTGPHEPHSPSPHRRAGRYDPHKRT